MFEGMIVGQIQLIQSLHNLYSYYIITVNNHNNVPITMCAFNRCVYRWGFLPPPLPENILPQKISNNNNR